MKVFTFLKSSALALCCASIATPALAQDYTPPKVTVTDHSELLSRFDYAPEPDGSQQIPEIHATLTYTWNNPDVLSRDLKFDNKLFVKRSWQTHPYSIHDTVVVRLPPQKGNTNELVFITYVFPDTTYSSEYSISGADGYFPKTGTAAPLTTGPGF